MPTRWVGGRGSIASPTKDQLVEAKVVDDDGADQGTILIRVKRLYSPGEQGRMVLADWISASDAYYRQWAESKMGRPSTIDGSYHFCKGDPATCEAGKKDGLVVHLGKWRGWKEDELMSGSPDGYDREATGLITRYFKKESGGHRPGEGPGGLPWKGGTRELKVAAGPRILKNPATKKAKPGEEEEVKAREKKKEPAPRKPSQLKSDLDELRRVTFRTPSRSVPRKVDKRQKKEGTPKRNFEGGGLGAPGGDGDDGNPSEGSSYYSSGTGEEEKGDESNSVDWGDSPSDDGDDDKESSKKKRKKKCKKDKDDDEDDDEDEKDRPDKTRSGEKKKDKKKKRKKKTAAKEARGEKKKKKKRKKHKKKKEKSGKRGIERLETDKGPFGMGESKRMKKDVEDDDESDSDETSSSQSFHKAPSGLTLHLRLQRYAMKHPGRLATRLLQRMEKVCRLGGAVTKTGSGVQGVKPCALAYFLTILTPSLKDRWSPRTHRELRVLTEILDHLAENAGSKAADIIAQRIKALEQSVQDGNTWKKAKFLELIESDEVTLADRGEVNMMQKEVELEEKFRGKGQWRQWEPPAKGEKGKKDGKGKGKYGGKKTPAQEAAEKKGEGHA